MSLKKRIYGKLFERTYFDGRSPVIRFVDGSVLTVHTTMTCDLVVDDGNLVTDCTFNDAKAEIRLGSRSVIEISMDENDLQGPEFYEFHDVDGTRIVKT